MQLTLGRSEGGVPGSALCDFDAGIFLNLYKIAHFAPLTETKRGVRIGRANCTALLQSKRPYFGIHHCHEDSSGSQPSDEPIERSQG